MDGVRTPTRALVASAAGALLLTLAACSGDDDGGAADGPATPDPSASSAPSASPSETPPETPSETPSEAPGSTAFPGVTPASGPELGLDSFSVRVPEGWEVDAQTISGQTVSASTRGATLQLIEQAGAADVPLEDRVEPYLESQFDGTKSERLPDVVIGDPGVEALRFRWTTPGVPDVNEDVLTYRNGYSVSLSLKAQPGVLKRDPQLFDSILASLTWG